MDKEKMRIGREKALKARKGIKKPSLRAAINAKCRDCSWDRLDKGTWLQQVTNCQSIDCPLYNVRPKSKERV